MLATNYSDTSSMHYTYTHTVLASKYNSAGSQHAIGSVFGLGNETKGAPTNMLMSLINITSM